MDIRYLKDVVTMSSNFLLTGSLKGRLKRNFVYLVSAISDGTHFLRGSWGYRVILRSPSLSRNFTLPFGPPFGAHPRSRHGMRSYGPMGLRASVDVQNRGVVPNFCSGQIVLDLRPLPII